MRVAASFDAMRRSIVFPLVLLFALLIAMVSAVRSEGSVISLAAGQDLLSRSLGE